MTYWNSYGDIGLNHRAPPFTYFLRDLIKNARERTTSFELVRAADSIEIKLKKQATDCSQTQLSIRALVYTLRPDEKQREDKLQRIKVLSIAPLLLGLFWAVFDWISKMSKCFHCC